jgi:hypothetical protein
VKVVRHAGVFAGLLLLPAVAALSTVAHATAPPTTDPSAAASTAVAGPTTAAPTTLVTTTAVPAPTTTTTPPPVDRLAGVAWIQRAFASPCSDGNVQLIGGSAVDGESLAVIDDVVPLDSSAGLAVAFLSCHTADGSTSQATALLVSVTGPGAVTTVAEQSLGRDARVVAIAAPTFTVETPEGTPVDGSCCAPLIRRVTYSATASGFSVSSERQVAAFLQTVGPPAIGDDGDLVRASIPAPALCYQWDDVYLSPQDLEGEPIPVAAPSAEIQTLRLALIHITGRWITPSSVMTEEMSDVVRQYQESRGLTVDGQIGAETTSSLSTDLGCTTADEFRQIVPIGLGPRRFASIPALLAVMDRYGRDGSTGNASLTELLADAGWDAANSLFLGCYRWENPPTGMSCSWSGRTPLQLIGLVDDPAANGIGTFSILYARSAAPG